MAQPRTGASRSALIHPGRPTALVILDPKTTLIAQRIARPAGHAELVNVSHRPASSTGWVRHAVRRRRPCHPVASAIPARETPTGRREPVAAAGTTDKG
jgi:hypothetical protein